MLQSWIQEKRFNNESLFLAKNGNIIFTTKIALKFHSSQSLCSKQLYYIYFLKMVKW